ncbi:TonB-dependent receptor plug domain-containing protein [Propionivibrio sp.]|uniref:TonB-dependent receptor plug domain-containing protein n=1 Tax=Propionivibrio sp. TaxID=2212460 RepID=UPI0039E5B6E7
MAAFPAWALADSADAEKTLGEIHISTTKSTIENEDSTRAISVVKREDIENHATTGGIQEALAKVPGVAYARSGGLGGQIVMRGFNSNSTRSMLAIDGDRYRGRSTLEFNLIDPNAVERIEVLRGPASVLWGADAMNGVVNVITRRAKVSRDEPFALDAKLKSIEYNSVNDLWAGRGEIVGGGNGFDVLVGMNYRDANDYQTPKGVARNSDFESKGLDFRLGYSPTALTRWELAGRLQEATTGRAGGLGAAPGAPWLIVREDPIKERYLKLGVETKELGRFADLFEGSLYVRKLETDIYQQNATNASGTLAAQTTHQHTEVHTPTVFGGKMNAIKEIADHVVAYGMDFYHENFNSRRAEAYKTNTATGLPVSKPAWSVLERGSTQTNIGFYASDDWKVAPDLTLSGAARWDRIKTVIDPKPIPNEAAFITQAINQAGRTRIDSPVTGSVGVKWDFVPSWSLVSQVSQGFRAPSGNERTLSTSSGTVPTIPSPDLEPERSMTYEAGIRFGDAGARFNATVFKSDYKDLIRLVKIGSNYYQRQNVQSAEITGVELDGELRIGKPWLLRAAMTATRGTNKTADAPLDSISPLTGWFSVRYGPEGSPWSVETVVRGAARHSRVEPDAGAPAAGLRDSRHLCQRGLGAADRRRRPETVAGGGGFPEPVRQARRQFGRRGKPQLRARQHRQSADRARPVVHGQAGP